MPSSGTTITKRLTEEEKRRIIRRNEYVATLAAIMIGSSVGTLFDYLLHVLDQFTDRWSYANWEKSQAPFHTVLSNTLSCLVCAFITLKIRNLLNKKIENDNKYIVTDEDIVSSIQITEKLPLLQVKNRNDYEVKTDGKSMEGKTDIEITVETTVTISKRLTEEEKAKLIRRKEYIAILVAGVLGGGLGSLTDYVLHAMDKATDKYLYAEWEKSQAPFHAVVLDIFSCMFAAFITLRTMAWLNRGIDNDKKYIVTREEATPLRNITPKNTPSITSGANSMETSETTSSNIPAAQFG